VRKGAGSSGGCEMFLHVSTCCVYTYSICRGAGKSLAFPISPMGGSQHNQKNFSWMG
jgi:hypothetical protein